MQQEKASSSAITALVLGIVSFLGCGFLTGIPAWIIGKGELKKIDAGESSSAGRTLAQVGMILGIVATVLGVIGLVVWFLMAGAMVATGVAGGGAR